MTPQKEREAFEAAMRSESFMFNNDELEFQDGRNCYKHYWMHLMWRSWLERAALADAEQEVTLVDHGNGNLTAAFATPRDTANYSVEVSAIMDAEIHEPSQNACGCGPIEVRVYP
jgi:hypothetical protein